MPREDEREAAWHAVAARQFDALAPQWRQRGDETATRLHQLLPWLGAPPGSRVLDAGCGTGNWSVALAEAGYPTHGVDLSPAMIAHAEEVASERGFGPDRLTYATGPVEQIARPDASFAAVICLNVLDFVPRPGAALVEFARLLRPGGRLIVATLGARSPVKREWWRRFLPDETELHTGNDILPWELAALLNALGWRIIHEEPLFSPSMAGTANGHDQDAYHDDVILRQTIASSYRFVAER